MCLGFSREKTNVKNINLCKELAGVVVKSKNKRIFLNKEILQ